MWNTEPFNTIYDQSAVSSVMFFVPSLGGGELTSFGTVPDKKSLVSTSFSVMPAKRHLCGWGDGRA